MVLVNAFAEQNIFMLNVSKCEVVLFSKHGSAAVLVCEVDGFVMPADVVKECLGYRWKDGLSHQNLLKKTSENLIVPTSTLVVLVCFKIMPVHCFPELCWNLVEC